MDDLRLRVRGLEISYSGRPVVHGIDLDVAEGEGHALVGPSGSGKTSAARGVIRLVEPTAGTIRVDGHEISALSDRDLRAERHLMQMVFQEPQTSLDPRWRVERSVAEPLRSRRRGGRREHVQRVGDLLERVGLPAELARRYPHELSIGQQQRVAIARALAPEPKVLVCDEPVAALDTSMQGKVLDLLRELQQERSLAILLVTHDLAVAAQLCRTMSVLDAGRIIETGPLRQIVARPRHERTAALVAAARRLQPH